MSYQGYSVAVVVPCHNEETQIQGVLDTMPPLVDHIVVVDDQSPDRTVEVVRQAQARDPRIVLIVHEENQGVGGAIATGYKWARDHQVEVTAVMAGDGQMDPDELPSILDPVVRDQADYAKGNRLFHPHVMETMPRYRLVGNAALSFMTKIASGYWHTVDTQSGYTAISLEALQTLDLDGIYKRYGVPNDILVKLNVFNFRVVDVPIRPVYNVGEKSGIRLRKVLFSMSLLMIRLFFYRMWHKYVLRDFHPLVFFYLLAMLMLTAGLGLSLVILAQNFPWGDQVAPHPLAAGWVILAAISIITGLQFLLFAMWFDKDHNRHLCVFYQKARRRRTPRDPESDQAQDQDRT